MKQTLLNRFLRYVALDTQSDPNSESTPSSNKQLVLANALATELKTFGLTDVSLDANGYVMASIPSNIDRDIPPVGFIAHMDTSPDMPGNDVKPQIIEGYDGGPITLNTEKNIILSPVDFPDLLRYKGQTLITTDGTTLLGADDKAGIAEIMTAVEYLMEHPVIKHGKICIAFTPDEEIGRGVDHFDVNKFGASFAYTLDGGGPGELEYENFNAAAATITIKGNNIHPGYAKNKMLNASLLATEFISMLPVNERPEFTEHYDGFFHLTGLTATVEAAELSYIIRDHDKTIFERRKKQMQDIVEYLNKKYKKDVFVLELKDQYYNMREMIEPVFHVVEVAMQAMRNVGVPPDVKPIRGGTDGSRLSYMGLPCPNLFAGGHNFHGKHEFVAVETMVKAVDTILNIVAIVSSKEA
ncbi:MAG: peptidase T [Bacteroidetes bacterium GWF2_43_63]|nr:MAG: peptidase T [Bacteroidetes bacterium GWF2_43_63]HBG70519.1 peptidase T [Bacteroidales bacterium]HCB61514.1 peptidase T [Bacteroidales bacterium]